MTTAPASPRSIWGPNDEYLDPADAQIIADLRSAFQSSPPQGFQGVIPNSKAYVGPSSSWAARGSRRPL